jgi:leucyl aminopeptidase
MASKNEIRREARSKHSLNPAAIEVVILRPEGLKKFHFPVAQEQAAGKIAKLEKKFKDPKCEWASETVHFSEGGLVKLLVLKKKPKAFELQTLLRKEIAGLVNTAREQKMNFVVAYHAGLGRSAEAELTSYLVSLIELTRWKPVSFAKKPEKKDEDSEKENKSAVSFYTSLTPREVDTISNKAQILARANSQVRTLAELPANELRPEHYLKRVEELLKTHKGVKKEFFDVKALKKMGAGAFTAVTSAEADSKGGILHLSYKPARSKNKAVALVGKGVCFDTGGYNIKTGAYMHGMHRDMTGSAVALSLFLALVELKWPGELHAYLALAENHISPSGYKPNDLVYALNGMSIEVVDTDAEGRMLLSDTLALASKTKPSLIVDFATLTGAIPRAIDTRRCGAFSNSLALSEFAVKAGDESGERLWHFPIGEDYNDNLKSEIADVLQCASGPNCDHIYAATFLSKFVGDNIPWLHIDLAADTNKGGLGLVPTENTGFGVRWGVNFLERFFTNGKKAWL